MEYNFNVYKNRKKLTLVSTSKPFLKTFINTIFKT